MTVRVAQPSLVPTLERALGVRLTRLSADSRRVHAGVTFAAYPGERADGRDFIPQALQAGADAVLWDAKDFSWRAEWSRPNLGVVNLREWIGPIAAELQANPSRALHVIGVTGTNGKTSCSQWLAQCFDAVGEKCGVIGTLGNGFLNQLEPSANTTPDPIMLQQTLAQFRAQGAQTVSMEVSSHGLEQGRVSGVEFDIALFTNLSRDHLDYHRDMDTYFDAKAKLFSMAGLGAAVINLDDAYGERLARDLAGRRDQTLYGFGFSAQSGALTTQFHYVRGSNLQVTSAGVRFDVHCGAQRASVQAQVLGEFNANNLLGVLACLLASGMPLETATRLVSAVRPVAGRMQRVALEGKPVTVVDYAHSPDALEKVLLALRASLEPHAQLWAVFGCGGDRDRGKRALMGEVAARLAHHVVVTSDNPRNEDPQQIIREILAGMHGEAQVETDRSKAIALAIAQASANDIVLIAGKGHEDYQEIAGQRTPFSDAVQALQALECWPGAEGSA